MEELSTATAFVTGAGKGIGRGIARALASHGTRLALVDVDAESLRAVATELRGVTEVTAAALDVRDRDAFARAVEEVEQRLGAIDVLCNNAGVVFPEDLAAMTYEVWDLALGVNLGGLVNGIQTVVPRMMARGTPAHIVNTASIAVLGPGGGVAYTTGKYAVVGLSEALHERLAALELPIGVTVLCPGAVATDIAATGRAAVSGLSRHSDGAREYADRLTDRTAALLNEHGADPDAVGRMVVEAIRTRTLFVFTDRAAEGRIRARAHRILSSLPPAAPRRAERSVYEDAASLREG